MRSFLENFMKKKLADHTNYKKIVLFSDSAGGQNRILNVVRFFTWFAQTYNVEITQMFPVRGHSYCQCDRNFGIYGSILKKKEKIESPQGYLNIMKDADRIQSRLRLL